MKLLGSAIYDPAIAVTKNTTAALAMTALDTVNLRLAVTIPASGKIRVHMRCVIHGATTFPQVLLGAMNGATVLGRVAPLGAPSGTALATTFMVLEADFIVTGLTPGAMNVDAAYGVETLVAATGIKYGGPNNATANDAFGAFTFEIYDPTSPDDIPAGWLTAAGIAAGALNGKGDWNIGKTGYALSAAGVQAIWDALTTALTTVGSIGKRLADDIDATISSRSTYAGADTAGTTTLLARIASALTITGGKVDVNDKTGFSITAASIQAIWDALTTALTTVGSIGKRLADNVDATISSRSTITTAQVNTEADTALADVGVTLARMTNMDAAVSTRATPAQVNTEVVDGLNNDVYGEPGQGAPPVSNSLASKISYLYKMLRNKKAQTATTLSIYGDDEATVDHKATVSDDGTTATKGELVSGP